MVYELIILIIIILFIIWFFMRIDGFNNFQGYYCPYNESKCPYMRKRPDELYCPFHKHACPYRHTCPYRK